MAVTSMSRNSIGFGQEKSNRVSGKDSNLEWCQITTTPTGSFSDADGVWNYWVFKSSGTLTVGRSGRVDYLVVAGGATGSSSNTRNNVGGGGAGGVIESPEYAQIDSGAYAVTIGAGGAATTSIASSNNGNNSSIGSLAVAIAGGGAGDAREDSGKDGGCGGASGDGYLPTDNFRPGDGTFGQGFRGGVINDEGGTAGAGGGAGGVGTSGTVGAVNINGGVGRTTTIISTSIATAQAIGEVNSGTVYFAGGGGAGDEGAGGLGGGGAGSPVNQRGVDCLANTGGGSGNADTNEGSPYAGAGGSGVVIVRTRV